jgi:iron(II)-dependent oxidoreductase
MNLHAGRSLDRDEIAALLHEARARTLLLVAGVSDGDLTSQHTPLMSPPVWDLGHIAHFEEVWLLENILGAVSEGEGLRGIYNPFANPRAMRDSLPLPGVEGAREYMGTVRRAVLDRLRSLDLGGDDPLLLDGFVFRMVLQHEYQHNETLLQTFQIKRCEPYRAPRAIEFLPVSASAAPPAGAMVRFPGGRVVLGTDDRSQAYDNERPAHDVELEPFWIDAAPVTCGDYLAFMRDGGYERRDLWTEEGWSWRHRECLEAPAYWFAVEGRWHERVMDRSREVDPTRPVCHVCYWEANAFARWAGKRLPTEAEWEAAACWDAEGGTRRRFPWGDEPATSLRANVDVLAFDTAPVGTYPLNVSPLGCYGMIGDVWEWTSSDFTGYPGFEAFPYREYSEVFFGDEYKVLRGGSWATRGGAIRGTFRNWDYPIRRQIFSGFRCARDDA